MVEDLRLDGSDRQPVLKFASPDRKWEDGYAIKIVSVQSVSWRDLSMDEIRAIHEWTGSVISGACVVREAAE
mgnify:CR=1 FL=1